MSTGGRDLQRAFGLQLTADVRVVGRLRRQFGRRRGDSAIDDVVAHQMPQQLRQMIDAGDANRLHGRRFAGVSGGDDQLAEIRITRERGGDRQRSAHRHERAVERQLADENTAENRFRRQKLSIDENADCDGQVECRPFLLHIGR